MSYDSPLGSLYLDVSDLPLRGLNEQNHLSSIGVVGPSVHVMLLLVKNKENALGL